MVTRHPVYMLISRWSWDSTNTEIATITVEEGSDQKTYEEVIASGTFEEKRSLASVLQRLAAGQNGSQLGHAKIVALCRVTDWSGDHLPNVDFTRGVPFTAAITMTPICYFGDQNNIIPVIQPARS